MTSFTPTARPRPDYLRLADAGAAQDASALVEAGQAAERRGNRVEAREHYEGALEYLTVPTAGPQAATVMRWIARTYMVDATPELALEAADAALEVSKTCGDHAGAGHAINVKAAVHWQQGNLDEAERLFLEARSTALAASDAKLVAMTSQNLGVIASIRGELSEALRHYAVALEHCRTLGLVKDICAALNNLGKVHTELMHWPEAERAYLEAAEISATIGDLPARIGVTVNLAEMWLARGDAVATEEAVQRVLQLSAQTEDTTCMAQICKLRGILGRKAGNPLEADAHFARAIELAEARHDSLLLAEVLRERADLDREQGRNREALQNLNRAHRLFSELRARRELAHIDQSMGKLESDFLQVVRHWGESIEAKDRYTQGHCTRVADLACELAARAGVETQELFWFRIGALLHDVGKLVIPSEVLNKAGRLTDEEWTLMRRHPSAGVEMLAEVDFPWDVRPIIESHHERWDGKGYPHGLAGAEIPLSARILALADVYDALTSERSYKRGLPHDDAMNLMRQDVGTAFDPAMFVLFEEIVSADRFRRDGRATERAALAASQSAADAVGPGAVDELTGLMLRRALSATATLLLHGRTSGGRTTALLFLDVDHFKRVNDTFGHLQGDEVLRMVAHQIRDQSRSTDFVGRYGGDEFVALLPDTSLHEAREIGDRIRRAIEGAQCPRLGAPAETVAVTVSIGVAVGPVHGDTADALFKSADMALYAAKRRGRNAVGLATASDTEAEPQFNGFIGRTPELHRLASLLDAADRGAPHVAIVLGEAGIGKSELLRQLIPEARARNATVLFAECLEADVRPPYAPWAELVAAMGALDAVPARDRVEHPRPNFAVGAAASSDGERYAILAQAAEYVGRSAAHRTLVLVIDDIQWADAGTWDVLESVIARLDNERILICLTARPEDLRPDAVARLRRFSRSRRYEQLALNRFGRNELAQLIDHVFGVQKGFETLLDYVERLSEGNPLFAAEMLRGLVNDGVVRFSNGAWVFAPVTEPRAPLAVRDLLKRRLSRLSEPARAVLTHAAVLGREFNADRLGAICAEFDADVLTCLDDGLSLSIIESVPAQSTQFAFTHGLFIEELLSGSNPARLRRIRERVSRAPLSS